MAISKAIILKHITLFLGDKRETCFFLIYLLKHIFGYLMQRDETHPFLTIDGQDFWVDAEYCKDSLEVTLIKPLKNL